MSEANVNMIYVECIEYKRNKLLASPVLFIQTQDKIPSPLQILSLSPVFHSILQDVLLQDHPDCPAAGNLRSRSGMEQTRQGERGKSSST